MKKTTKRVDKREKDIKKKLSAAILMLLVSCIMVVTSTYAWFTLSTAPEVKGIQTTIGGNGNLEIALANNDTWVSGNPETLTSTTGKSTQETNVTWGNLIDVTENYGVDLLTLTPAKLSYVTNSTTTLNSNLIEVPKYGSDGRVSELSAGVMAATYNATDKAFIQNGAGAYGLRALGISAAMTARQSGYMVALSGITSNAEAARVATSQAMQKNGGTLGSIAVSLAAVDLNGRDAVEFTTTQFIAMQGLVNETIAAVASIEQSIISAVKTFVASEDMQNTGEATASSTTLTDAQYTLAMAMLDKATLADFTVTGNTISFKYQDGGDVAVAFENEALATVINDYKSILTDLTAANDHLDSKDKSGADNYNAETTKYTWAEIKGAVEKLMNMNGEIRVSGKSMDELKQLLADKDVTAMLPIINNLVVELGAGSGLYYTIASLVGEVKANIKLDITYAGISAAGTPATIKASTAAPKLPLAATALSGKSPSSAGSTESNIISDRYAFALDLLFRTNAADSDLLLATQPKDRIYSDNTNAETMGAGSTMTFTKSVSSFSEAQMVNLIKNIKLVFIDESFNVLATAGLDVGTTTTEQGTVNNYTVNAEGAITADIRIIDTAATATAGKTVFLDDGKAADANNVQKICDLAQNAVERVSVLVYLDGETITNKDVANAATSMSATMNLQFESSAELTPMEYSGLHQVAAD